MGDPDTDVRAVSIGAYGFCYSILNVPYQELTQLSVATKGSAFRPGCRIAVWGMH